jgi:RNA polymerase sigma factor (sigma-70 family)
MTGPEVSKRAPRLASTTALTSDARLAQRAAERDERAFAAIFRRYHQEIYRFCLSILGNAEDARDAMQNTMVKALQALPGEKREIQLRPWLYRVAHNESIDLVRKRRETTAVDPELTVVTESLAETAAQRERLRQLLLDLGDLPDRQRAALVMRELGGLGFEQIGEAFETSPAVARQTVYEARLNLRSLEKGREMSCEEVMHRLSNADGRVARRRDLQAHLRACPDCRAFRDAIDSRRRDFAALAPLPAIASAGVLHAVLGGAQGAAGGATGASGAAVAAGAGKAVTAGFVAKSVAAVAIVAAVGVSAADRSGLIHTGLPGGSSGAPARRSTASEGNRAKASATPSASKTQGSADSTTGSGAASATGLSAKPAEGSSHKGSAATATPAGRDAGAAGSPPQASQHGRGTATAHRNAASAAHGRRGSHSASKVGHASPRGSHHGHASGAGSHPHPQPKPASPPSPPPHSSSQPPAETPTKTEQSSGSASEAAESSAAAEGKP